MLCNFFFYSMMVHKSLLILSTILVFKLCNVDVVSQTNNEHINIRHNNEPYKIKPGLPDVIYNNVLIENTLRFSGKEIQFSDKTVFKYSPTRDFSISVSNNQLFAVKYEHKDIQDSYRLHLNTYLHLQSKKINFTHSSTLMSYGTQHDYDGNRLSIRKSMPNGRSMPIVSMQSKEISVNGSIIVNNGAYTSHPFSVIKMDSARDIVATTTPSLPTTTLVPTTTIPSATTTTTTSTTIPSATTTTTTSTTTTTNTPATTSTTTASNTPATTSTTTTTTNAPTTTSTTIPPRTTTTTRTTTTDAPTNTTSTAPTTTILATTTISHQQMFTYTIPHKANIVHFNNVTNVGIVQLPMQKKNGRKVTMIMGDDSVNLNGDNQWKSTVSRHTSIT